MAEIVQIIVLCLASYGLLDLMERLCDIIVNKNR